MNWNPPRWVPLTIFFLNFFCRLTIFFFRNINSLSKKQLLFSFLCIVKQKKISEQSESFWKFLFLKIYLTIFCDKLFFVPEKKNVSLKKTSFEILWSKVWKGGFQLMQILGFLGMYFDAAVVFVTSHLLLFRLVLAIL